MKYIYSIGFAIILTGCSKAPDETKARLEKQDARVAALERDVAALRESLKPRPVVAPEADPAVVGLEKNVAQLTEANYRLESRLALLESRRNVIEKPKTESTEGEPEAPPLGKLLPSKSPAVSIYSAPDNQSADFIETPAADNPDRFPVRVTGVSGRKTVVGTHKTTRIVESAGLRKDAFGRNVPVRKEVEEDVNDYVQEVVFSVQNLTRTEKNVSYTAGAGTRTVTVQPGETVNDISVRSAIGSDLHIEVSGQMRNYPVTY